MLVYQRVSHELLGSEISKLETIFFTPGEGVNMTVVLLLAKNSEALLLVT
jgi:hypothetical protein